MIECMSVHFRSQVVRQTECEVEPAHHHERDQSLLPRGHRQHRGQKQGVRGTFTGILQSVR